MPVCWPGQGMDLCVIQCCEEPAPQFHITRWRCPTRIGTYSRVTEMVDLLGRTIKRTARMESPQDQPDSCSRRWLTTLEVDPWDQESSRMPRCSEVIRFPGRCGPSSLVRRSDHLISNGTNCIPFVRDGSILHCAGGVIEATPRHLLREPMRNGSSEFELPRGSGPLTRKGSPDAGQRVQGASWIR
jgi:hypothetical protein